MIAGKPPGPKEIIDLLSKLKDLTPEYPADLLAARRAAFLKQVAVLTDQLQGWSGKGAQGGVFE